MIFLNHIQTFFFWNSILFWTILIVSCANTMVNFIWQLIFLIEILFQGNNSVIVNPLLSLSFSLSLSLSYFIVNIIIINGCIIRYEFLIFLTWHFIVSHFAFLFLYFLVIRKSFSFLCLLSNDTITTRKKIIHVHYCSIDVEQTNERKKSIVHPKKKLGKNSTGISTQSQLN